MTDPLSRATRNGIGANAKTCRYLPLLRSKVGEVTALEKLPETSRERLFPIIQLVTAPSPSFVPKMAQAWPGHPLAIDGLFNFERHRSAATFVHTMAALRDRDLDVVPVIECGADEQYVSACNRFVNERFPRLVVKVSLGQLASLGDWLQRNRWDPEFIDLIVATDYVSHLYGNPFLEFVRNSLRALPHPDQWRAITLVGAAAPADDGSLKDGRNEVPRLDWLMWRRVESDLGYRLNFGDFATMHPDLREAPSVELVKARVSAWYCVKDKWIVWKGTAATGGSAQPLAQQYREHARRLCADPEFGGVPDCWADQRIVEIAENISKTGNRTTWLEISLNRHIAFVESRLP